MLQTFRCFNCCGLRIESVAYEELCPNCGGLMTLPCWNLDELLIESGIGVHTEPNQTEFASIGNLLSDEPLLLSYAMNERYAARAIEKSNLEALFVRLQDAPVVPVHVTAVHSQHPQVDFFLFHNWLIENTEFYGKVIDSVYSPHFNTRIAQSVAISSSAIISNAVIESGATIGPGTVIGADGARLIRKPDGTFFCALHGGSVYIGEGAYVGANTVVVRSMWRKPTTIGAGAYVGNLVNVGHNVQIEPGAIVLPGVMLCGRSEIAGTGIMSIGSMVAPGIRVEGTANLGAVVTKDVSPNSQVVSGNFAVVHEAQVRHVKELARNIKTEEKEGEQK